MHKCAASVIQDEPHYYCEVQKQIKYEFGSRLDVICDSVQQHELLLAKIDNTQRSILFRMNGTIMLVLLVLLFICVYLMTHT